MGYHKSVITQGVYGEFSKIQEEFEELRDAVEYANPVMALTEMSDLIGAIVGYAAKWNITLGDLIAMMDATGSAFKDGSRTPKG